MFCRRCYRKPRRWPCVGSSHRLSFGRDGGKTEVRTEEWRSRGSGHDVGIDVLIARLLRTLRSVHRVTLRSSCHGTWAKGPSPAFRCFREPAKLCVLLNLSIATHYRLGSPRLLLLPISRS